MASVKVAVRVRPFNKRELSMSSRLVVDVKTNQVILRAQHDDESIANLAVHGNQVIATSTPNRGSAKASSVIGPDNAKKSHKFSFDYAYWSHNPEDKHFADQSTVFRDLGTGVVDNAFNGYNVCVFAYGQTGSGKTYTMMGSDGGTGDLGSSSLNKDEGSCADDNDVDETCDPSDLGLIPRICSSLFSRMKTEGKKMEETTYRTEVSYLEIYNERVKDLLSTTNTLTDTGHKLKVREHPKDGPYVENLSKHLVMNYKEILAKMEEGNKVRTTASTAMNDTSSRSHSIFTITFVHAGFDANTGLPHETVSKIHLVDLAGSERADATGATGKRLKEGAHINKSLVTLGSVISALADVSSGAENSKKPHFIPYRDSVLTWLLKDSLGGNSKTIMIATISPADINKGETLSTLRYANRAKNIINKPTVNEDANVKLIRELRAEIDRLKDIVSLDPVAQRKLAAKEAQERHLTEEWTEKWKEAANILKEQSALALKRTGWGVVLDSDKPHLIGIDEDVLSTGIALYHIKDGDTIIGGNDIDINHSNADGISSSPDIVLKGPNILSPVHCVIHLSAEGSAVLEPMIGALCIVNAVTVTTPTALSQGCVIVLGRTNMFRYNDPREAAKMRLTISNSKEKGTATLLNHNRSLLSQSLSDLRIASNNVLAIAKEDMEIHEIKIEEDLYDKDSSQKSSSEIIANVNDNCQDNTNHKQCNDVKYSNDNNASATMYSNQMKECSVIAENSKILSRDEVSSKCNIDYAGEKIFSEPKFDGNASSDSNKVCDSTNEKSCLRDSICKSPNVNCDVLDISKIVPNKSQSIDGSVEVETIDSSHENDSLIDNEKRMCLKTPESGQSSEMTTSHESGCSSTSSMQEMAKLYDQIGEQKETVMKCLENEGCDVSDLDEQISLLKEMQKRYALMEFDHARSLWQNTRSLDGSSNDLGLVGDYDSHFSRLVEQEVDRRLFQEKIMRSENDFQEKEMLRIEKERELAAIRRQHEREIYLLKKQLHEASVAKIQPVENNEKDERVSLDVTISIPSFCLKGLGSSQHVEYNVHIAIGGDSPATWTIMRRYRQFRDLHRALIQAYGSTVHALAFPSRRLFGNRSNYIAHERKRMLQTYLNTLIQTCASLKPCPLAKSLSKKSLIDFSSFFEDDIIDNQVKDSIPNSPRSDNSE